jgi:hypothetical protein
MTEAVGQSLLVNPRYEVDDVDELSRGGRHMPRIEIDLQRHPRAEGERVRVFGTVSDAEGTAQEYSGWLELLAVLEDLATATSPDPDR